MLCLIWCDYALHFVMSPGQWPTRNVVQKDTWNCEITLLAVHFWCIWYVGQAYICVYTYINLSGFLIIHPDLVLVISPSCMVRLFPLNFSVPSFLLIHVLLMECSMFSATCWLGLLTMISISVFVLLWLLELQPLLSLPLPLWSPHSLPLGLQFSYYWFIVFLTRLWFRVPCT